MDKNAKLYIIITLAISWTLTIVLHLLNYLVSGVLFLMLVPAVVALGFRIKENKFSKRIFFNENGKGVKETILAFVFAIIVPTIIITLCAILAMIIFNKGLCLDCFKIMFRKVWFLAISQAFVSLSVLNAFGEEFGWRNYLLPQLNKNYSKVKSSTVVGIVWALYHFPVLIILTLQTQPLLNAIGIALIQALAAFTLSYTFNYCFFISNRVYPTIVLHGFWNLFNPFVLGSIYFGTQGYAKIGGPIYLVNGEGIFGIIFGAILAFIFIKLMQKEDLSNKITIE